MLFDMVMTKKRFLDLGTGNQVLFFQGIMNGLDSDRDVGDVMKVLMDLGGSISFACGDKSHQLRQS